jgi:uncharacterized protein YndB with AHSA1/START domain
MATITKDYFIAVPPRLVWEALTDAQCLNGWGAGPDPVVDLNEGGAFSLWGGDIHGTVLDIELERRLVLDWRLAKHDGSTEVTVTVEPAIEEERTTLTVVQANVRDEDVEEFDRGWDEYYGGAIKEYLEAQGA